MSNEDYPGRFTGCPKCDSLGKVAPLIYSRETKRIYCYVCLIEYEVIDGKLIEKAV